MGILVKKVREGFDRKPTPSYGLTGSQSAKTTPASGDRGFDDEKKPRGVNGT